MPLLFCTSQEVWSVCKELGFKGRIAGVPKLLMHLDVWLCQAAMAQEEQAELPTGMSWREESILERMLAVLNMALAQAASISFPWGAPELEVEDAAEADHVFVFFVELGKCCL